MTESFKPDRDIIFTLRPYQQKALELFTEAIRNNQSEFHIVAPPGSGKTIMGLSMMLQSQRKALILSPNTAIQGQWERRFHESTDIFESANTTKTTFSSNLEERPTYLNLTYQSISVKNHKTGKLHKNAQEIMGIIKDEGYSLFILDECHHLTNYWAEILLQLKELAGDVLILGLTATPPVDAEQREKNTYLTLLGEVDYEIPLPLLVKNHNLAPYQDLVYFTLPSDEENAEYQEAQVKLAQLLLHLNGEEDGRKPLTVWVHECLEESRFQGKVREPFRYLRAKPDRVIAYARFLKMHKIKLPITTPWLDEMQTLPSEGDFALVLGDYLVENTQKISKFKKVNRQIIAILKELGFKFTGKSFSRSNTGVASMLPLSKSKLSACENILQKEFDLMGDSLRALILVDYEFGKKTSRGITSVDVMNMVTSHEGIDPVDPIMLTGRSVLVDDDLLPSFLYFVEQFKVKNSYNFTLESFAECGYIRIDGSGSDWHSKTYIHMISELFEIGISKCLISTRSLLGEGWDSKACNTLIDITTTASFVSVNQIRGRTIRIDPHNEMKCANNWDIVSIVPGVHFGLHDFQRLEKKFKHFYGISEDGIIEKGLGHAHSLFAKTSRDELILKHEIITQDMLTKAGERIQAIELWEQHQGALNIEKLSCEIHFGEVKEPISRNMQRSFQAPWIKVRMNKMHETTSNRVFWMSLGTAGMSLLTVLTLGAPLIIPATIYTLYLTGEFANFKVKKSTFLEDMENSEVSLQQTLKNFAKVVLEAGQEAQFFPTDITSEFIHAHCRTGNCFRIILDGVTPELSNVFANAVWELLGPVQNHKYIIERRGIVSDFTQLSQQEINHPELIESETEAWHPVPSIFGRRRSNADIFKTHWNTQISTGSMVYTRSEEGQTVLAKNFGKRPFDLVRERKTIWE